MLMKRLRIVFTPQQTFSKAVVHPLQNTSNVENWMRTLNAKATTAEGRNYMAQLSSLVNYYNKSPSSTDFIEFDWAQWNNEIVTEGLVDKVKQNYESLVAEKYETEAIAQKVRESEVPEYRALNNELMYHNMLWKSFYFESLVYFIDLKFLPNFRDMMHHEKVDYMHSQKVELTRREETHNWLPGAMDDVDLEGYVINQFAWGKKVTTYFRHPSDDFRGIRATKNIMGR